MWESNQAPFRKGEQLEDIEKARLERLRDLVPKLVTEDRLVLPQAGQEDEYKSGRLAPETDAEWARLSLGVRMNHRLGLEDKHVELALRA